METVKNWSLYWQQWYCAKIGTAPNVPVITERNHPLSSPYCASIGIPTASWRGENCSGGLQLQCCAICWVNSSNKRTADSCWNCANISHGLFTVVTTTVYCWSACNSTVLYWVLWKMKNNNCYYTHRSKTLTQLFSHKKANIGLEQMTLWSTFWYNYNHWI